MILFTTPSDSIVFLGLIILFVMIVVPLIIHYEFKQVDKREAAYKEEISQPDLYDHLS